MIYTRTIIESILSYACHGVGDTDSGQVDAIGERGLSYAFHGAWDGYGGDLLILIEGVAIYTRHLIGYVSVFNGFRNNDIAGTIFAGVHCGGAVRRVEYINDAANVDCFLGKDAGAGEQG